MCHYNRNRVLCKYRCVWVCVFTCGVLIVITGHRSELLISSLLHLSVNLLLTITDTWTKVRVYLDFNLQRLQESFYSCIRIWLQGKLDETQPLTGTAVEEETVWQAGRETDMKAIGEALGRWVHMIPAYISTPHQPRHNGQTTWETSDMLCPTLILLSSSDVWLQYCMVTLQLSARATQSSPGLPLSLRCLCHMQD